MRTVAAIISGSAVVAATSGLGAPAGTAPYIDYEALPDQTIFPGPWEEYIRAPANKSYVTPARIWRASGNVATSPESIVIGQGAELTMEFDESIGGRVCFNVSAVQGDGLTVNLAYSESSFFAGPLPDATTERADRDLPLPFTFGNITGPVCVGREFIRGAFKYLTIQAPVPSPSDANATLPQVALSDIWVNCTAFPSQTNGRAYTGYFHSSSPLLNRIWYAGAWTLQLCTVDPAEGSSLVDLNREILGLAPVPPGTWYSNYTISPGRAVCTDGAKRDRVVWPGDMSIAVPGIAVSTFDMASVRSALDVLFDHQYGDGSLPYAGPPLGYRGEFSDTYHLHTLLGAYNYVLYSGDVDWLRADAGRRWAQYRRALAVSVAKVDALDLLLVTSPYDWIRPGMTGHNGEASALLYTVLSHTLKLASWLGEAEDKSWTDVLTRLDRGIRSLYCPDSGLFADNAEERGCAGPQRVEPQDGNSWAVIARLASLTATANNDDPSASASASIPLNVSTNLRRRWLRVGAPAVEFPNVVSPFASGFELMAHRAAGRTDRAVELALLEWGYLLDPAAGFTNSTLAEGFRADGYVQYPAYPSAARNSHAHGWSTGPTAVLVEGVLGIELRGPAGREWVLRPDLTSWLGFARGGFATGLGRFEVSMRRVVLGDGGKESRRKGVVVEVEIPGGTSGVAILGEEEIKIGDIRGARGWVVWETGDGDIGPSGAAKVEELSTSDTGYVGPHGEDEDWHMRTARLPDGRELTYDSEWTMPEMEEWPAGVVDWEALEENYRQF